MFGIFAALTEEIDHIQHAHEDAHAAYSESQVVEAIEKILLMEDHLRRAETLAREIRAGIHQEVLA